MEYDPSSSFVTESPKNHCRIGGVCVFAETITAISNKNKNEMRDIGREPGAHNFK